MTAQQGAIDDPGRAVCESGRLRASERRRLRGGRRTTTASKRPSSDPSAAAGCQRPADRAQLARRSSRRRPGGRSARCRADGVHAGHADEAFHVALLRHRSPVPEHGDRPRPRCDDPVLSPLSTQRAKRGSRTVKYWAPWSKRQVPCSRVDIRPPGRAPCRTPHHVTVVSEGAGTDQPRQPRADHRDPQGLSGWRPRTCSRSDRRRAARACAARERARTAPSTGARG